MGFAALCCATSAAAAVRHIPIKSRLPLGPGEAYTVTVPATEPTEIGWQAVQAKPCTTDCVQATDISGGISYRVATRLGASMKYKHAAGAIVVEYKNISTQPVVIDVYRIERICEAAACRFIDAHADTRWLVFKVGEFKSITTSRDESYSIVSGVTIAGKPFTVTAVWWTDDRDGLLMNCAPFVKRYLDSHTSRDKYAPYIISGQATGQPSHIVLRSIDTCAAKAPNFGVPEKNVYK